MGMSKILLFGKNGQIGSELVNLFPSWNLIAVAKEDVNVVDRFAVERVFNEVRPEIVINAVAYNDVDGAERYPDLAIQVNALANGFLATLSAQYNALYISYSSDFVFDGRKTTPYLETDLPQPINKYGESKLMGDLAVQNSGADSIILRTSSVYSLTRPCFLTRIIQQANKNTIPVRNDLVSCPTSAKFLAYATAFLVNNYRSDLHKYTGLYNLCSSGFASRYQWAVEIQKLMSLNVTIVPVDGGLVKGQAPRPAFCPLSNLLFQRTFDIKIPDWNEMLYLFLKQQR